MREKQWFINEDHFRLSGNEETGRFFKKDLLSTIKLSLQLSTTNQWTVQSQSLLMTSYHHHPFSYTFEKHICDGRRNLREQNKSDRATFFRQVNTLTVESSSSIFVRSRLGFSYFMSIVPLVQGFNVSAHLQSRNCSSICIGPWEQYLYWWKSYLCQEKLLRSSSIQSGLYQDRVSGNDLLLDHTIFGAAFWLVSLA